MEPEQFAGMTETTEHGLRGRLRELEQQNEALRRDLAEVQRLACDDCKLQQLLLEEYALQHAHEAVYLIDANHRLVYVNEEACRALGYSREELLGMTVQDIDAHYSSMELVAVQDRGRAEGTVRHETRHRRHDGSIFPVEIQSSSFEYQGQYMGIALARDISKRKHSEMRLEAAKKLLRTRNAELLAHKETLEQRVAEKTAKLLASNKRLIEEIAERKQAEERLSSVAANVPGFIFTVRVEPDGRTSFPFASPGVEELFGVSPEDIRRDAGVLRARYHPDDLPRVLSLMTETERTLGLFRTEIRIANRDSRYVWIEIRSMPKRLPDGATEWHGIMLDIAARKEAERELEASRMQLQRAIAQREATREEERKRIAREVHDELGQILTGLKLHVSHLDRICALEANPLCEYVREIAELTDQAMGVARNIAVVLRPVESEMGIVSALELQVNRFSTLTGIRCECSLPDDALILNERCTTALYRIVQELLTNVARHANADRVQISLARLGADYVVQVRDNGAGFEPGAIKQDSFGLAGIRERVSTLGGTMGIDSQAGRGTEVTVRIPAEVCHD
jgi:PAS domain S-box-containing protein